jgi:hypothetical protein
MYYDDYSIYLNTTTIGSAGNEWTEHVREEALKLDSHSPAQPENSPTSTWITLAVVTVLLLISFGTLAWGTVKVAEGASSLSHALMPARITGLGNSH